MSDFDSRTRRVCESAVWNVCRAWGASATGLEHVPLSGPLVVAFNHASLLDGPLVGSAMRARRRPMFLAKKELFSVPLLGELLLAVGSIPLERRTADHGALRAALDCLDRGGAVSLSPEGTRVRRGERREPKLGVSFLAEKSGARVLPVRLVGTADFPFGYPLSVRIGQPLSPPAGGREAAAVFARTVMDAIYSL